MEEIKVGDVVYLKSQRTWSEGSRDYMTVGRYISKEQVECYWFIQGEIRIAILSPHALAKR